MTIVVISTEVKPGYPPAPDVIQAEIEISDGVDTYAWTVSGIPIETADVEAWLAAREDELWIAASAAGRSADLFTYADRRQNAYMKAFFLAFYDRTVVEANKHNELVDSLNWLMDQAGVPAGNPNRPTPISVPTIEQAKDAVKDHLPNV